jgi:poly-gamma-glutamate synthesis protein (capsule biosynthesis protein)
MDILAPFLTARLKSEISNAKRQADIVVVYVHWGMECYETPLEYQQNLAKMYIDEGADIVIGSILMYYKVWNIIKTES